MAYSAPQTKRPAVSREEQAQPQQPAAPQQPVQQAPTFRTLQQQGFARPAPPVQRMPMQPMQGFAPGTNRRSYGYGQNPALMGNGNYRQRMTQMLGGGQQQPANPMAPPQTPATGQAPQDFDMGADLLHNYQNPSAYTSSMAADTFTRLNRLLSEGYDTQRSRLQDEMASRGLLDSTNYGGRLGDLGVQQSRAQADLAQQIETQAAQQYASDRSQALGNLLGYDQQQLQLMLQLLGA